MMRKKRTVLYFFFEPKCKKMSEWPDDDEEYKRFLGLMRKDNQRLFYFFLIGCRSSAVITVNVSNIKV